jgi:restriction system protein
MARKNETLINLLAQAPWWVSVVLAAIFYVVLKFIVPAIEFQSFAIKGLINAARSLSWREFEELVAKAYRRQGYTVIENPGSGPDGGIDLVLKKDGNLVLVQCKQWRAN